MKMGKLILVLGGTRSGKSEFAEKLAQKLSHKVSYLATSAVYDNEMARRVKKHQDRRPETWITREETIHVPGAVEDLSCEYDVILLDCLTLWLTNLLLDETIPEPGIDWADKEEYIINNVKQLASNCKNCPAHVIVVSSEVGLGVVPENSLARSFRDVAGLANQEVAKYADEVYLVTAGLAIELKSRATFI